MTILITSGGTIIKIDDVRHVGNFSSGEFLSQIGEEAIVSGHKVIYVYAKGSKRPFYKSFIFDPSKPTQKQFSDILKGKKLYLKFNKNVEFIEYQTFEEYESLLKKLFSERKIDIAFLGAAVSDYSTDKTQGKISSSKEVINIKLHKTNKVIKNIKSWSKTPVFQVGFKLLSNVSKDELIEVAYKSGLENKSDLTVANDLKNIKSGDREVFVVTPERGVIGLDKDIAKSVFDFTLKRANTKHFKSIVSTNIELPKIYEKEFLIFKLLSSLLYKKSLMTPFFNGSKSSHGSLGLRVKDGFLITSRGSNKESLDDDGIVLVKNVDFNKRIINIESISDKKASLNAPLFYKIFSNFKNINAIVHTHSFDYNYPVTDFSETPGTVEYASSPLNLLKKNKVVNLKHHGLIAIDEDMIDAVTTVIKNDKLKGSCYNDFPEFYDVIYQRYFKSVPDFVKLVSDNTPKKGYILDMASGTGEVTIPLLKSNFKILSLDLSKGMLDQLKKKVNQKYKTKLETNVSSITNINFENKFDTVCIRQAINYLNKGYLEKTFKKVNSSLKKDGCFVFNAPNFKIGDKEYKDVYSVFLNKDCDAIVVEKNKMSKNLLKHSQKAIIFSNNKNLTVADTNSFYMYSREEFEQTLKRVGFKDIKFLSSGLNKYIKEGRTLYCVAKK